MALLVNEFISTITSRLSTQPEPAISKQDPSGRPQSQTHKTSKLTPNDKSQHVQLINLEP
jgi:hypothetical protein